MAKDIVVSEGVCPMVSWTANRYYLFETSRPHRVFIYTLNNIYVCMTEHEYLFCDYTYNLNVIQSLLEPCFLFIHETRPMSCTYFKEIEMNEAYNNE